MLLTSSRVMKVYGPQFECKALEHFPYFSED